MPKKICGESCKKKERKWGEPFCAFLQAQAGLFTFQLVSALNKWKRMDAIDVINKWIGWMGCVVFGRLWPPDLLRKSVTLNWSKEGDLIGWIWDIGLDYQILDRIQNGNWGRGEGGFARIWAPHLAFLVMPFIYPPSIYGYLPNFVIILSIRPSSNVQSHQFILLKLNFSKWNSFKNSSNFHFSLINAN